MSKRCQIIGLYLITAYFIVGVDMMASIYDDPFMEILDRLISSGLDENEACMLVACFLQERKEMEHYIYSHPN